MPVPPPPLLLLPRLRRRRRRFVFFVGFLLLILAAALWSSPSPRAAAQVLNFYALSCPQAEAAVEGAVSAAVARDRSLAPALLRLMFHDCFVQGCDASILLERAPTAAMAEAVEKEAGPNRSVRGYEVIDAAKAAVEQICPGVVSCADIVAMAARDAVVLTGGPSWQVPAGRRDALSSRAAMAEQGLPSPSFTTPALTQAFLSHGLTQDEMITLSGAHTIGRAHCSSFSARLAGGDPTLDAGYASQLRSICSRDPSASVPLDPTTPDAFDNNYFSNLAQKKGLLTSDQDLHDNVLSHFGSNLDSSAPNLFEMKFAAAMVRLSSLNVLFGPAAGEIRTNCRSTNSDNNG